MCNPLTINDTGKQWSSCFVTYSENIVVAKTISLPLHFLFIARPAKVNLFWDKVLPSGEQIAGTSDSIANAADTSLLPSSDNSWGFPAAPFGLPVIFGLSCGNCLTRMQTHISRVAKTRDLPGISPPVSLPSPNSGKVSFSSAPSSTEIRNPSWFQTSWTTHEKECGKWESDILVLELVIPRYLQQKNPQGFSGRNSTVKTISVANISMN